MATETGEHTLPHQHDEIAAVAAHASTKQQHKAAPCSFPAPWPVRAEVGGGAEGDGGGASGAGDGGRHRGGRPTR
ncbi:hypothetical protein C2845_PM17G06830 [Panicum miliaceum]|uniref:Uncharacterized protein n=1 Tax=Panicum miliaceum TaxID=4540 RepID=A0A3L6PZZ9_PANMI|nr:hypothetical protein C2845_PM17G06830 [Panicum miliaceum]